MCLDRFNFLTTGEMKWEEVNVQPLNYRGSMPSLVDGVWALVPNPNWVACVYAKDERGEPLECHDTGSPVVDGDLHDGAGLDACFTFYRSVRDKYSRPDIEELKPAVAKRRIADAKVHQANVLRVV